MFGSVQHSDAKRVSILQCLKYLRGFFFLVSNLTVDKVHLVSHVGFSDCSTETAHWLTWFQHMGPAYTAHTKRHVCMGTCYVLPTAQRNAQHQRTKPLVFTMFTRPWAWWRVSISLNTTNRHGSLLGITIEITEKHLDYHETTQDQNQI